MLQLGRVGQALIRMLQALQPQLEFTHLLLKSGRSLFRVIWKGSWYDVRVCCAGVRSQQLPSSPPYLGLPGPASALP